jgi:MerC mercury resistance protein
MPEADDVAFRAPAWRIMAGRLTSLAGVIACTVACASSPVVVATLSAAGIGFLRTDWLLIPLDVLSAAFVVRGFIRTRRRHRHNGPLILAVTGAVALMLGMRFTGGVSGWWLGTWTGIVLLTTVWDQRMPARR